MWNAENLESPPDVQGLAFSDKVMPLPSATRSSLDEYADGKVSSPVIPCHQDGHALSLGRRNSTNYTKMRSMETKRSISASFGRQVSMNISRTISNSRTFSYNELQEGARQYYRQNSHTFGQVLPVDDDNELFTTSDEEVKVVDVERGTTVHDTAKGGLVSKEGAKPSHGVAKSRLELIILEQSWFSVYKRLNFVSFMVNLVCLVLAATGYFSYAKSNASLFSVANVLIVVLVRNEVFLRLVFWLAVNLLGYRWVPLRIKTMTTAFLQSVGGIHSGCGIAAVMWLVYDIVEMLKHRNETSDEIVGIAWAILFLLSLSCLAALPILRHIHHNFFERVHRFSGWSSLILVWAFVILSDLWDPATQSYKSSSVTSLKLQSFWYTAATTVMIILPWIFLRKVAVDTVVPPTKLNALLHFKGGIKPGILARISPSPFSEWHAFGIISDGKERHTILAGAVGDFTKGLVNHPPKHIWVRTFHFAGLPYLTNMYNKVVHVATGSGICVFMSFLMQPTSAQVHVIWIAKNIRASYGNEIWDVVQNTPSERLTMIDTATSGRPKTKELVVTKAKEWHADVVIVTSNPSGTYEIVNGCKSAGIPAFGPIWDS